MPDPGPIPLKEVLAAEYQSLRPGADFSCPDTRELFAKAHAQAQPFSALCISGGGIRSATFALGAIQGLAQHGVLPRFDYLSTVSGGGFIGSWLTAWSNRAGGLENITPALCPNARPPESGQPAAHGDTPDPIEHLRDYNSYMSPKVGLLSADTWTLVATMVRNLLLNWAVLLPMLMAALLLPRLYLSVLALPEFWFGDVIFAGSPPAMPHYDDPRLDVFSEAWEVHLGLPLLSGSLFAMALFNTLRYLPGVGNTDHTRADYLTYVLLPLVGTVLAYVAVDSLYFLGSSYNSQSGLGDLLRAALVPSALAWLVFLLVSKRGSRARRVFSPLVLAIFMMAAGTGLAVWVTSNFLLWSPNPDGELSWPAYVTVGPPAILLGYVLGTVLFVGLSSRFLKDEDREWMSRSVAGMLMFCLAWLFVCGTVLVAPKWVVDWQSWVPRTLAAVGLVSAWASAFGSAMLGRGAAGGTPRPGAAWSAAALAVRVAPVVFIVALAVTLTLVTNLLLTGASLLPDVAAWPEMVVNTASRAKVHWDDHYGVLSRAHPYLILALAASLLLLSRLLALFVNINTFSLHAMYRERLVRAYLGASNAKRNANKFTGFARGDDFAMHTLDPAQKPLHVINLTLNLVQANRLAWQQRKAQPFTVTPLHCGNFELGYRASSQYGGRGGITLGTAVAISGAAASPNMGSYSSPASGFIMTLLNARLGSWLGNPGAAGNHSFTHASPRSPMMCLLKEAFGLTSNQSPYVYLSDGGHFENLGLYEMVLRRCRCIVVIDAGADPDFDMESLGNALRKIRIDLGIPVTFADAAMGAMRTRSRRCAAARIGYSAVDPGASDGSLLYLKPMLCGNEPPDVDNYGRSHPDFPHEGTGKQWFDESQTESYRMLGLQTVEELCAGWQGGSMTDFTRHVKQAYLGAAPETEPLPDAGPPDEESKMIVENAATLTIAKEAAAISAATQALEHRDFAAAIELLEAELSRQPDGKLHARLALALFQDEQYESAQRHYAAALLFDASNADWQAMHALASANATAGIHVHVPDLHYFDRDVLLASPVLRANALPEPLPPGPGPGLAGRLSIWIGDMLGAVITFVMHIVTTTWGRVAGYRDAVWTNWYHRPQMLGILTLAYMRDRLNARNLGSSYPQGTLTGFQHEGQQPPPGTSHFRTADGSWNNLADPKEGAAGTRFLRNVEPAAIRPETGSQLLTPNPREISRTLFSRPSQPNGEPAMQEVPFLNMLAAAWIQFMNGDWINHGEIHYNDVIEVPLPEDDPARTRYWQTKMFIGKTQADPTRMSGREEAAASSINEVTHWWDGSQIYGSDQATQDRLRSMTGGKMRLQEDGRLPLDRKGIEETGFTRNWWVGLSMLHTLFVREHNAICDHLAAAYPDWDDNRLFNVARLINAAVMAKIHTVEWTPAILPNPALNFGVNMNWYGGLTNVFRKGKDRKTVADINVRNPEMGGVVGNPIDKHGRAFGLTEEFVEIYRLHSLLPETLTLRRTNGTGPDERVPFHASRQSGSGKITSRFSIADLLFSFGTQHPGALVLNNYPRFMQELSIPGNPFFDMGSVDIVRARERGVPRYNEFRRQLGLNPIRIFEDLTDSADDVRKLKSVYGPDPADVEKLDLLVGTLAEGHRPAGFGFGETMFSIFLLNATRRLQADRFFTDDYTAEVYTPEGLRWIDDVDFKTVILRHYPELAATGLANIRNGFEPWDTDAVLSAERHPLRASDRELSADPWRGDAHRARA